MKLVSLDRSKIENIRKFDKENAPLSSIYHIDSTEELNSFFDNKSFICYGIFQNKKFIGHCSYMTDKKNKFYLNAISIHKKHRKKGIGSNVFNIIKKEIINKGGKEIFLTVSPLNTSAVEFYKKMVLKFMIIKKMFTVIIPIDFL